MESLIFYIFVALGLLVLIKITKFDIIPATSDDWFIIFDIDAKSKILSLRFHPIIGFSGTRDEAKAITSNPSETKRLTNARKQEKISNAEFGISYSYGRWYRDGVAVDIQGRPEVISNEDFETYLAHFILNDFNIRNIGAIPNSYQLRFVLAKKIATKE
jgi:hypothetical protein